RRRRLQQACPRQPKKADRETRGQVSLGQPERGAMDETQKRDQDAQLDRNPGPAGIELQDDLEGDTLREECGVFGIFGHPSPPPSPRSASTPFSTAARKPPASSPTREPGFIPSAGLASSATLFPAAR